MSKKLWCGKREKFGVRESRIEWRDREEKANLRRREMFDKKV
jgi:hypothetical protein